MFSKISSLSIDVVMLAVVAAITLPGMLPGAFSGIAHAQDEMLSSAAGAKESGAKCPHYKVYYIDPSAQFFTPPVPIEDYAEFVFCSDHANLDEIRLKLKNLKPVRSQVDAGAGRIKVVPRGKPDDAMTFCSTGEITYRGKQYRLDRRMYEPSLLSIREEGDRQRQLAIERDDDRNPASTTSRASRRVPKTGSVTPSTKPAAPSGKTP